MNIKCFMTVLIRRRFTGRLSGVSGYFSDSCPVIRSRLYATIASSSTSALVANLPDGSRSTPMSDLSSEWYCSHWACVWYSAMISSSGSSSVVCQVLASTVGINIIWPCLSIVRSVISYTTRMRSLVTLPSACGTSRVRKMLPIYTVLPSRGCVTF